MKASILIVEDDTDTAEMLCAALHRDGWTTTSVRTGDEALERIRTVGTDIVLTDVQMPGMSGIELCERLAAEHPDVLPIVLTGIGNVDIATGAIRAGAFDFLVKPAKTDVVSIALGRAIEHLALKRELQQFRLADIAANDGIAGSSPAIAATLDMVKRVAESDATVLITGESGTGKELVARALHAQSARRLQPFAAINCGAMPASLLESELFGHVRGAFTDAKSSRPGLFVQAGSGTVFLDEIGEMPIEMQVKLLRVLQERRVRPVGGDEEVTVHARVVTATNRNLDIEVAQKRFREDLFYRINVVAIPVPALRDRPTDILPLARHFIARSAARSDRAVRGINPHAARLMMAYDWPGNVRELENCIERAVAMCRLDELTVDDLPAKVVRGEAPSLGIEPLDPADMIPLHEMRSRYVRRVLAAMNGNKTHAAEVLGIDRRSVYRRIAVTPEESRAPADPADAADSASFAGS